MERDGYGNQDRSANNGITGTDEDTVSFEYIKIEETGSEESEKGIISSGISVDQILEDSPASEEEVKGIVGKVNEFIEMLMELFEGLI